jgi:hypothetical protein
VKLLESKPGCLQSALRLYSNEMMNWTFFFKFRSDKAIGPGEMPIMQECGTSAVHERLLTENIKIQLPYQELTENQEPRVVR